MLDPAIVLDREYCIRRDGYWQDGNSDSVPTQLQSVADELLNLKKEVRAICSANSDRKRRWRLHTQTTHPLSSAPKQLRERHNCSGTSQAYCKFLEIISRYPQLLHGSKSRKFRSFHICEAPGHFITALDRFLCTFHSRTLWSWQANSLNPHHEGTSSCDKLLEDELIVRAPKRWHFGIDDSGDITKWDRNYVRTLVKYGRFHLVTADGSFYTQDDPAGQEVTTLPLLTAEFRTALRLLKDKGSLIIKVYTLYTQQTRALLSDVLRRFDDVYMFKPMSSKGGNNERYLICLRFRRAHSSVMDSELANKVLVNCETYFSTLQSSFIKCNLDTFNNFTKAEIGSFRNTVLREFFRRTHAERLAFPLRKSHLTQRRIDRPWSTLVEQNYIEILKQINDSESAVQFLKEFHQKDVMTEHERLEEIEVEFDEDELKFVARSTLEGQQNKSIVRGPVVKTVLHSLFVPPGLLRSLHLWIPEAVIDLCGYTPSIPAGKISYLNSIKFNGEIEVDASKLCGQVEWCTLLVSVFEKIKHYAEDLPRGMGSFVHKLLELADDPGIQRAVPISMLAMFHPYILELNRVQWRKIFDVQQLTAADVENSEP
ncbi:hypothetical protein Q1695_004720 [Nippostrongylus brasiliensis]|nr:hypothetical protein Q1695_004720 [Nippostrongylus brasiliensis]